MRHFVGHRVLAFGATCLCLACGSSDDTASGSPDASARAQDGEAAGDVPSDGAANDIDGDAGNPTDAGTIGDASEVSTEAGPDASLDDGGLPADRFITQVVSFTPGPCAGFGASEMPEIVEGPPHGGGASQGSVDVLSLGNGGEIVVSFPPNAIVDGPGPDFIVFENPFDIGGNPMDPYAELGEVSVSDDGTTWSTYPCTATSYPYGECAGWHVVYSAPGNGISPVDPATAGGDAFDLADLGLTHVQFVRIRDITIEACPDAGGPTTNGFDLDAISIVNAAIP